MSAFKLPFFVPLLVLAILIVQHVPAHSFPFSWNSVDQFPTHRYLLGIVNGVPSNEGEWPMIASIQYDGARHYCGGTVWNANHILTAAHCV